MLQVLLLAAGFSQRFGDNKLLQRINDTQTVLDASYRAAACLQAMPLVIINDDARMRAHCAQHGYAYRINARSEAGMAGSIACGVTATAEADGWAICLADMPCIRQQTMQCLHAAWDGERIVVPRHQAQAGHPVLFPRQYFAQLTALQGDRGARRIVQDSTQVTYVEVDDPGILLDIDTPADLQQAVHLSGGV